MEEPDKNVGEQMTKQMVNVVVVRSKTGGDNFFLKYTSLVVLVAQNASQVLLIRYARTRNKKEMFLATSAVFWTEVVKLITCILIISTQERSFLKCINMMYDQIIRQPVDTAKVCVPSIIYTIQNNLLYVAVSHLAAATFMVTYQLKILTTALFSVLMLRKPLSRLQWFSLLLLFVGCAVVQLNEQSTAKPNKTSRKTNENGKMEQNPMIGLFCVICACVLSGFSGIYFEKILKGSDITVWMRNVQLSVIAIPISYITMQAKDGPTLNSKGMFYGYDLLIWTIIGVYAVGGLTVAVVIRYADNILKGFATSVSIIVSCIVSTYLFDFVPTSQFVFGTALVMVSIYVYSKYPATIPSTDAMNKTPNGIPPKIVSKASSY